MEQEQLLLLGAPGTVWNRRQSCQTGVSGGNTSGNVPDVARQHPRRRRVLKDLTLTTGDSTGLLDIGRGTGIAEGATDPSGSLSAVGSFRSGKEWHRKVQFHEFQQSGDYNLNHINKTKQEWGESPAQLCLHAPPTSRHLMQVLTGTEGS
ncbi:hypothetical protein HGM15179_016596 [Zosterops borbonicus]|uniref:Uncharacterized protein n=1 Tax=Zosterops borbonicus TaxID=364589 RepID=A0A8K1G2I4_9PASS|nr:hypothetical protein HGM15179_016596 [Zosterops borbonicus]